MICFEIYTNDGRLDRSFLCRDGHFGDEQYMNMYDYLTHRFNLEHEEAEEAVSWCEFACLESTYEADEFEIYVTWED